MQCHCAVIFPCSILPAECRERLEASRACAAAPRLAAIPQVFGLATVSAIVFAAAEKAVVAALPGVVADAEVEVAAAVIPAVADVVAVVAAAVDETVEASAIACAAAFAHLLAVGTVQWTQFLFVVAAVVPDTAKVVPDTAKVVPDTAKVAPDTPVVFFDAASNSPLSVLSRSVDSHPSIPDKNESLSAVPRIYAPSPIPLSFAMNQAHPLSRHYVSAFSALPAPLLLHPLQYPASSLAPSFPSRVSLLSYPCLSACNELYLFTAFRLVSFDRLLLADTRLTLLMLPVD